MIDYSHVQEFDTSNANPDDYREFFEWEPVPWKYHLVLNERYQGKEREAILVALMLLQRSGVDSAVRRDWDEFTKMLSERLAERDALMERYTPNWRDWELGYSAAMRDIINGTSRVFDEEELKAVAAARAEMEAKRKARVAARKKSGKKTDDD